MSWNPFKKKYHDDEDSGGGVKPGDLRKGHHYLESNPDLEIDNRLVYEGDDNCPHPAQFSTVDRWHPNRDQPIGWTRKNSRELRRLTPDEDYNEWYENTHDEEGNWK